MSTEIYGAVEIKMFDWGSDAWYSVIDAGMFLPANYDLFGCLFGVRNYANFEPLFSSRGAPPDCCDSLLSAYKANDGHHDFTWCFYSELKRIDLSELSLEPNQRFWDTKSTPPMKRLPTSEEEQEQRTYTTRREALSVPEFQQLLELMSVLAKHYGEEGVRLSVYFFG